MPKRFTLCEAEELLPTIEKAVQEAVQIKSEYEWAEECLQAVVEKVMRSGGMIVDRQAVLEHKSQRDTTAERLKGVLEAIEGYGCLLKDLNVGLIDFPTLFRGEEVYLCWKLGEPRIGFWHGIHEGFAGRKPINQDFLDHHRGDRPN